jgi:hypothetical protein
VTRRAPKPPAELSPYVPPVWRSLEAQGRLLEHHHQAIFVSWFRKTFPDVRIFATPNGGKRSKREAERLKLEGVSSGVPDLYVPEWRLWIEMKTAGSVGRVSEDQWGWLEYLQSIGDRATVCRGHLAAIETVRAFVESRSLEHSLG